MKKNLLLKIAAVALVAIAFISCKQEVQPTGVKLNQTSLALETGATANLIATVEPAGAVGTVTWTSSNDGVASIADGVVTAKSAGSATITAKISTFSATCSVTVTDPYVKVTSVTLDHTSLDLVEGDAAQLTATVAPDNATDKTVTWKSSDTKVATVSASGEVVAVAEGKATITATAGDASAACEVAVAKKVIAVESISLNETALELTEGETATLTATVLPENATDKTVTWSCDNTAVATVADGVVTAVAEGTAKVTAHAGDASAVCTVTVKADVVKVTEITISEADFSLAVGETKALTVAVKPENATDKTVTWSSDNAGVATVSSDGVVTGVAAGNAKITVKANGGDVSDFVNVTVTAAEPEGTTFEDWLGTWAAKSGVKKNTLEITEIEGSDGNPIENFYFVFGWQKFENLPAFGYYLDGDLAFLGGTGLLLFEDEELFTDDPEKYDLMVLGFFNYQGKTYINTDEQYVIARGSLDGKKATMEAMSFEDEGETFSYINMQFVALQKTGEDAGTFYTITQEAPLPFPVKLTKSSSGAPAKGMSEFRNSGVKFEKTPLNVPAFKR